MITNTRLLAIALMLAGSVAGCDGRHLNRAMSLIEGKQPSVELEDVYAAGSPVVGEIIAAETAVPSDAAGEPVALMAAVVPEPVAPVSHVVCPEPFEWRGQLVQNPCWLEWN